MVCSGGGLRRFNGVGYEGAKAIATAISQDPDLRLSRFGGFDLNAFCELLQLPLDVAGDWANGRILDFLRARCDDGAETVFTAKLLLVGPGGAGKTSLLRRLKDGSFDESGSRATEGVAVTDIELLPDAPHGCTVAAAVAAAATTAAAAATAATAAAASAPAKGSITAAFAPACLRLYAWDFAGQVDYLATHPFFFSQRRALYVGTYNVRAGVDSLEEFLLTVHASAPGAPIVLVGSFADEPPHAPNPEAVARLRARFPQIKGDFVVSSKEGTGIEGATGLRAFLRRLALDLPETEVKLPRSYSRLQQRLRERTELCMTWSALRDLEPSIRTDEMLHAALGLFHDWGLVLVPQGSGATLGADAGAGEAAAAAAAAQERTVVVSPERLAEVMSHIITTDPERLRRVRAGVLQHADLAEVWSQHDEATRRTLLALTYEFDVAVPLPGGSSSLVPALLPSTTPQAVPPLVLLRRGVDGHSGGGHSGEHEIGLQYELSHLPLALCSKLIARTSAMHKRGLRWQTGVICEDAGNRALLTVTAETRTIEITACGPYPYALRGVLRDHVREVLLQVPGVSCLARRVPCPGCRERHFPVEFLEEQRDNLPSVRCERCHSAGVGAGASCHPLATLLRGVSEVSDAPQLEATLSELERAPPTAPDDARLQELHRQLIAARQRLWPEGGAIWVPLPRDASCWGRLAAAAPESWAAQTFEWYSVCESPGHFHLAAEPAARAIAAPSELIRSLAPLLIPALRALALRVTLGPARLDIIERRVADAGVRSSKELLGKLVETFAALAPACGAGATMTLTPGSIEPVHVVTGGRVWMCTAHAAETPERRLRALEHSERLRSRSVAAMDSAPSDAASSETCPHYQRALRCAKSLSDKQG